MEIKNPWRDGAIFQIAKPIYKYKHCEIYKLWTCNYLYVCEGKVFNQLAGINKEHLRTVADKTGEGFLYDRAIENLNK